MQQFNDPIVMHRRNFGRLSLMAAAVFGASTFSFSKATMAGTRSSHQGFNMLINALETIGKEATLSLAQQLKTSQSNGAPLSLHLRNAGLDPSDADILAKAFLGLQSDIDLRSFSVSYNPLLGDAGTIALAHSLPQTVREIGLVGCDMGDDGANALLTWANHAPHLKVLCIEGNRLSAAAKQSFRDLGRQKSGLYVVV